jgi:crossover junction endodeoxyribonuclease RusA
MSTLVARCRVDGVPVQQGSMRGFVVAGKAGARPRAVLVSDNKDTLRAWRSQIAFEARQAQPGFFVSAMPLLLVARFALPRPKTAKRGASGTELAATRPDLDKLARAVLDALTGIWFADDSLIVELVCSKTVCAEGDRPGLEVELWRLGEHTIAPPLAPAAANLFGRESVARAADDRPW